MPLALAASAVSVTGGIAFVGLMAPHLARALGGPRHQLFLPVAILLGGLQLMNDYYTQMSWSSYV